MTERRAATFDDLVEVVLEMSALDEYRKLLPRAQRPGNPERDFLHPLLDAIAIHARALIEFFYGRPGGRTPHPDDLRASDFVDGWNRELPDNLKEHVQQLDKHLAHITLRRAADRAEGIVIAVGPVADDLLHVAEEFAGHVTRWSVTPGTWTAVEWGD